MPNHGRGGRPPKGVANFKDEILDLLYTQKWKHHGITKWLADNKNIHISSRTLQRQLKKWDVLQQDRTIDTEELRKRIDVLFRKLLSDKKMLEMLSAEGFSVTTRGLLRIRKELGHRR